MEIGEGKNKKNQKRWCHGCEGRIDNVSRMKMSKATDDEIYWT